MFDISMAFPFSDIELDNNTESLKCEEVKYWIFDFDWTLKIW